MLTDRPTQHLLGALAAIGTGVVLPCLVPQALLAGAAVAVGGLGGNLLANVLSRRLRDREADPTLPDANHDLIVVFGKALSHQIAEFARDHARELGAQQAEVLRLAQKADDAYVELTRAGELPHVVPPEPLALMAAATRDERVPPVGEIEDWQLVVRRLAGHCAADIGPEVEQRLARMLHERLWESIRKALKRDFADDGRAYAALHLQFMGDVLARLDELAQPQQDHRETAQLSRELLEELRRQKREEADPKARRIIETLSPRDRRNLGSLIQRYDQLSTRVDRGFRQLSDEVRAADRDSRRRDRLTHRRLAWALGGLSAVAVLGIVAFLIVRASQGRQLAATTHVIEKSDQIRESIDLIVARLLAQVSEKDQQLGSLRTQLEDAVRRLAEAEAAGDASAKEKLDDLRAGGDGKLLGQFLDEQIAKQQEATIDLLRERAAVAYTTGEIDRAEQCYRAILAMEPDDLDATNVLGHIHQLRGDLSAAERQYNRLLELDASDEVRTVALGNLGLVARTRGDLDAAEKLQREALEIDRKLGRLEGQASGLGNLGNIAYTRGDLDAAENLHREALEIERRLRRLEGQAATLGNLGLIAYTRGELGAAEQLHGEALEIERRLGRLEGQASQLGNLGNIAYTRGDLDAAENLYRESLEIERRLGQLVGQADQLGNLGACAHTRGDFDAAEQLHREALEINRKLGRLEGQAFNLGNLGLIAYTRGDLHVAEKLHRDALEIDRKLGRLEGQAFNLGNLGVIAQTRGDLAETRRLWTESLDLYARIGMPHMVEKVQGLLDGLPPEER